MPAAKRYTIRNQCWCPHQFAVATERVDPEEVQQLGVTNRHMARDALGESQPSEYAKPCGQAFLPVPSFGLDVRRGLWTVQVDALLGGFEGAEVGLVLDVGHGDRVCAQRHRGEPVAPSERVSNSLQGGDGGYRSSQC